MLRPCVKQDAILGHVASRGDRYPRGSNKLLVVCAVNRLPSGPDEFQLPACRFAHALTDGCHAKIARRVIVSQVAALASSGKSAPLIAASRLDQEGRFAVVTDVERGMRWTRWRRKTSAVGVDGEVVWS
jgi:hypothetical protein